MLIDAESYECLKTGWICSLRPNVISLYMYFLLDYIGLKEYISEEISKLINIGASELTLQSELIPYCLYFQLKLKYYHSKRKFIINILFNTYFKIYNKINFNTYL